MSEKADGLDALKTAISNAICGNNDVYPPDLFNIVCDTIDHLAQRGMILQEGWVAVPREPTIEMTNKVVKYFTLNSKNLAADCYRAMLAAAPKMEGME